VAVNKYLVNSGGFATEIIAPVTSAGASDAGKLLALNGSGKLDPSVMPTGIGADTQVIAASEALSAGNFVNIYDATGPKVRKADATTSGKIAHGFVLSAVANGANATVYFEGTNDQVTGQVAGDVYLSTTPGSATGTPPSASGNAVQPIGVAISATAINFQYNRPIVLA
jgi:hypothetical protein